MSNQRYGAPVVAGQFEQGGRVDDRYFLWQGDAMETWKINFGPEPTVIRVLPGINDANPAIVDPWRFSPASGDFGAWGLNAVCAVSIGTPGKTWFAADPAIESPDLSSHPLTLLHNSVNRAVENREERPGWAGLIKGGAGRSAALTRPKRCLISQAAIFEYKNKPYNPPRGLAAEDKPVAMLYTPSAAGALTKAMEDRVEGYQGDQNDFKSMYVNGDPVSAAAGQFAVFYKLGNDPRQQSAAQVAQVSWGGSRKESGSDRQELGYGVFFEPTYKGMPAGPILESYLKSKVKRWRDVVRAPSIHEQLEWIVNGFIHQPDLLVYALDDFYGGEFDKIRPGLRAEGLRRLGGPVTVGLGGYGGAPPAGNAPAGPWGQAPAAATPAAPPPASPWSAPQAAAPASPWSSPPPAAPGGSSYSPPQPPAGPAAALWGQQPAAPAQPAMQPAASPWGAPAIAGIPPAAAGQWSPGGTPVDAATAPGTADHHARVQEMLRQAEAQATASH